jgi:EAL domain-containing protein (putative c-di-GMP-specific phosphodiesterase class I)
MAADLFEIDQPPIGGLGRNKESTKALVSKLIDTTQPLGTEVEGVETAEQLKELWAMKFDMGQGCCPSKPLAGHAVFAFLESKLNS